MGAALYDGRPSGSFAAVPVARNAQEVASDIGLSVLGAVASSFTLNGKRQMAALCPWRDARGLAPIWPVIWSGKAESVSMLLLREGDSDLYSYLSLSGIAGRVSLPENVVPTADAASSMVAYCVTGQSLGTNRVGPGPSSESWSIGLEYGFNVDPRLISFGTIIGPGNSVSGSDDTLENIGSQVFKSAVDINVGSASAVDGGYLLNESPYISAGIAQALSPSGLTRGEKLHLSAIATGGQAIAYFMPSGSGGTGTWWSNAFSPFVARLQSRAAAGGLTITEFRQPWIQGEDDHSSGRSKAQYRSDLDKFSADCAALIASSIGSSCVHSMISYQCGRIYAGSDTPPAGSVAGDISQVALAQGEKGISDAIGDAGFYCAGPSYGFEFSGISHMTERGYHQLQAMIGWFAADAAIERAAGRKMKPLHCRKAWLTNGNTRLMLSMHTPHGQGMNLGVSAAPGPYASIPAKPGSGITLSGGSSVPAISAVRLGGDGKTIIVDLATAWTGTGRTVGIAVKSPNAAFYYQGWQTATRNPGGAWVHQSIGANFWCDTHWSVPRTGEPIAARPISQIIGIVN